MHAIWMEERWCCWACVERSVTSVMLWWADPHTFATGWNCQVQRFSICCQDNEMLLILETVDPTGKSQFDHVRTKQQRFYMHAMSELETPHCVAACSLEQHSCIMQQHASAARIYCRTTSATLWLRVTHVFYLWLQYFSVHAFPTWLFIVNHNLWYIVLTCQVKNFIDF